METLIQLGLEDMNIISIPISINLKTRDSRLFSSIPQYLWKQSMTIIKIFLLYRTNVLFGLSATVTFFISLFFAIRYLFLTFNASSSAGNFWPTIILSGVLLVISVFLYVIGIIASLIIANRKLSEETLYRIRKISNMDI